MTTQRNSIENPHRAIAAGPDIRHIADYYVRDFGHIGHNTFRSREAAEATADALLTAGKVSGYVLSEHDTHKVVKIAGYCGP